MLWNLFTIIILAMLAVHFIVFPKLFVRAGRKAWEGLVPFYNFYVWLKILGRPWYWIILYLVPGINILVLVILNVETGIVFNQRSPKDQWLFGLFPWWKLPELAFKTDEQSAPYVGARDWSNTKKSMQREWGEAILFAIIVASVIRTFMFEAFTIPSPSMEGSLKVGDYLFVSKMSYGAKSPMTPLSFPFLHNAFPGGSPKSYLEWAKMPYFRLPGFGDVERYDPVVFNFPVNDSLINTPQTAAFDYYSIVAKEAYAYWKAKNPSGTLQEFIADEEEYKSFVRNKYKKEGLLTTRPLDKRENFIKRAIGLPGEDLQVIEGQVHINGEAIENPEEMQIEYFVSTSSPQKVFKVMTDKMDMRLKSQINGPYNDAENNPAFIVRMTPAESEILKSVDGVIGIVRSPFEGFKKPEDMYTGMYPHHLDFLWNMNNYGPIHIPAKDETIDLNEATLAFYKRVITAYEHSTFEERADGYYINGEKATKYTFKQDYYWMMGDNRNGSLDSRGWGFVPEDHIVGKAVFRWFSKENSVQHIGSDIRWDRMFQLVD